MFLSLLRRFLATVVETEAIMAMEAVIDKRCLANYRRTIDSVESPEDR